MTHRKKYVIGVALHCVVLQEKQAFLELRAIANMVKIGDNNWNMQGRCAPCQTDCSAWWIC